MTSNHVPLISAFRMTVRMTFRMTFRMTIRFSLNQSSGEILDIPVLYYLTGRDQNSFHGRTSNLLKIKPLDLSCHINFDFLLISDIAEKSQILDQKS